MKVKTLLVTMLLIGNVQAWDRSQAEYTHDFLNGGADVIYGEDGRTPINDYVDPYVQEQANQVAVRVSKSAMYPKRDDPTSYYVNYRELRDRQIYDGDTLICEDEKFAKENSLGDCSGFLIAPNKLLTAAHCADSVESCQKKRWVFNYNESSDEIKADDIYSCNRILAMKYERSKTKVLDYAIVELDRAVPTFSSLKYRRSGDVSVNDPIYTIGHPLGLPKKITTGARVTQKESNHFFKDFNKNLQKRYYFFSNLDAYVGNSGSPVFNLNTGVLEGILIQGNRDFNYNAKKGCLESNTLSNANEAGKERVMKITKIPIEKYQ